MAEIEEKIQRLVTYTQRLKGDEKGEAQVFCDRLFQAFGHEGYKEAGATLEYRVLSKKKTTQFADLLWPKRVLIEMKRKGTKLESHRTQAFDYWWNLRPDSPEYVILCNFEEFIIYNFSTQDEPLDKIKIPDLPTRYSALFFLFEKPKKPLFHNNLIDVTQSAAKKVSDVFRRLIARGENREKTQRFILQIIFSMFSEDIKLLPYGFFSELINDCKDSETAFDLINGLFRQMASQTQANGGRFKGIEYFNGGLFNIVDPVTLDLQDLALLKEACQENWKKVHPGIFGTIFQESMDERLQHASGSHFTNEIDIYKIVYPTIIQPWRKKIEKAKTLKNLQTLRKEITTFKVLDPACGSGNFLYIAFRELKRIEIDILNKIHQNFGQEAAKTVGIQSLISPKQFYGMDTGYFAVELAKVTLMLAKELSIKETESMIATNQLGLQLKLEKALPLDNLDQNIKCTDALFESWPAVDVIVGNPPYQSKNKIKEELGLEYVDKLRNLYPEIPGRADYCVYWFFKAHNSMKKDSYAGLVGTNTIRQNFSREGSLDYIVANEGTIFNAVSTQVWPGVAVVHVSIVCWVKGKYNDKKLLYVEDENGTISENLVESISSSLSLRTDVSGAHQLLCNKEPKTAFQGQTHGNEGFLLNSSDAKELLKRHPNYNEIIKPYLTGDEMLSNIQSKPDRFIIDFTKLDINEASRYKEVFQIIQNTVLPERKIKATEQDKENKSLLEINPHAKINRHHIGFYSKWWKLSYGREDMIESISRLVRYISCSRISKRPIFEFISSEIRPNDALMVFAFEDDYSFGILQSNAHILWYQEKCSTMKGDPRYTTESIWDTFPWPQFPTLPQIKKVAIASKHLRDERNKIMAKHKMTLRDVYTLMDNPGANILKDLHADLNAAVIAAYGFSKRKDILEQLLELNYSISSSELKNRQVQGPGLPEVVKNKKPFVSLEFVKP